MPIHTARPAPQWSDALERANTIRLAGAAVKADVKHGRLSISEALDDERSGALTILELLAARRRWGRHSVVRLLAQKAAEDPANRLSETKRVRELTARQKALLGSWCES